MLEDISKKHQKTSKNFIKDLMKSKNQYKKYPQRIELKLDDDVYNFSKRNIYFYDSKNTKVYFFECQKFLYLFLDVDYFEKQYGVKGAPLLLYDKCKKNVKLFTDSNIATFDI